MILVWAVRPKLGNFEGGMHVESSLSHPADPLNLGRDAKYSFGKRFLFCVFLAG